MENYAPTTYQLVAAAFRTEISSIDYLEVYFSATTELNNANSGVVIGSTRTTDCLNVLRISEVSYIGLKNAEHTIDVNV